MKKNNLRRLLFVVAILASASALAMPPAQQEPVVDAQRKANFNTQKLNGLFEYVRDNDEGKARSAINSLIEFKDGQYDVSKLNEKDRFGKSILDYMVIYGRKNLIDYLLDQESDKSKIELTSAQELAKQRLASKQKYAFEINALLNGGKTPPMTFQEPYVERVLNLIRDGNTKKAKKFIKDLSLTQLNDTNDKQGKTLLMYAVMYGNKDIVQAILDKDTTEKGVNAESLGKYTPLILAAAYGHPKIVEMLFQAGAKYSHAAFKEAVDHVLGQQGTVIPWIVLTPKYSKTQKVLSSKDKYNDYLAVVDMFVANPPSGKDLEDMKKLLEKEAPRDQNINKINNKIEVIK